MGLNDLHNWYQSHVALDLGLTSTAHVFLYFMVISAVWARFAHGVLVYTVLEHGLYVKRGSKNITTARSISTARRKLEAQWTADERKAANLDQRLKSLIMSVLLDDQMNSDFQDSPDDEEDTRNSHEYLNDLEEENQAKSLLAKSKRFFKKGTQRFSSAKATDQTECHKCGKKGHFARDCWSKTSVPSYQSPFQLKLLHSSENKPEPRQTKDFEAKYIKDEEEVSSDDNEVTEVKALMALTGEERVLVSKESARNCDWTKISMKKHVNTKILKENPNLRLELKELTSTTETWLNSSNKVNQCINEQIPTQKKKILGSDQLTEDTSNFESKEPVFVKSSVDNSDMPITNSNIHKNKIDPSVAITKSLVTNYNSTDESSVCSTPLPPPKKLDGPEPISGPKTIKSILKSKSTFKVETLKGIIINEPSSAPVRGNKSSSGSKTNSAPAGKLKNVKIEDDPPLAIVMKELNELKSQISKKKSSYSRNKNAQHVALNALQNKYKTQFKMNCELCGQNNHLSKNHHTGQGESSSRSRPSRPSVSFPSCIHCGYNDHHSDDCLYYPTCEICGSYDHHTHACGSNVHTTSDHNDIEWFRKRETLQAKKGESFKASKNESSSALISKTPTKRSISINQNVKDPLKKYDINGSSVKPPMVPPNKLGPNLNGNAIYETQLRGFDLKGYSDSDCVGCNMDRKSTSGACLLLEGKLV
ncbi:retrovirus-related pol polyprotein from transposon TNT 1-94 [Tanacetum coccineum]